MLSNDDSVLIFQKAANTIDESIVIADAQAKNTPIIYVNQAFSRITGYSKEDVLGKNCRFLQGPGTDPAAVETIREALSARKNCVVEILNYRKDGTEFWNRLSIVPILNEKGTATHFVGIQSDITLSKQLTQEISELNAMKTTIQTVNDITFNYMNYLQLFKLQVSELIGKEHTLIDEFERAFGNAYGKLQKLNGIEKYSETLLGDKIKVLAYNE